jgi:hypothetical protein
VSKKPEEGEIWEWRAFGRLDPGLISRIRKRPVRFGILGHRDQDIYFISPHNDQNLKLRRVDGRWVLKTKVLLERTPGRFELYRESAGQIFEFPLSPETVREAARLLETTVAEELLREPTASAGEFSRLMANAETPISTVDVRKVRSQFEYEDGWIETSDVVFPSQRVQSLSLHATVISIVERALADLTPGQELIAMNYIEACRKWR